LQSLITFLGAGDQIQIEGNRGAFSLAIKGPFAKDLDTQENLVLKAAEWLSSLYPNCPKAHIVLTKNLPISSGIGGGSSDAAATIAALLDFWEICLDPQEQASLIQASGVLGADVPVCLAHHLLQTSYFWVDGSGKEGKPTPLFKDNPKHLSLVLINPLVTVSTPEIFKRYDRHYDSPILPPLSQRHLLDFLIETKNCLTPAALQIAPVISDALDALSKTKGCLLSRMSGSGATCFGIYRSPDDSNAALQSIKSTRPDWWVYTSGESS